MQTTMIEIKRNDAMTRAIARAKNERPKVKPVDVAARVYTVTGSRGDIYTVRFAVSGGKKFASCDCKGGQAGMVCKHVAAAAAVNIGLQKMRRAAEQSAATYGNEHQHKCPTCGVTFSCVVPFCEGGARMTCDACMDERKLAEQSAPVASDYQLLAANGRPIRHATKVTFANGRTVKFIERLPIKQAIAQATRLMQRRAAAV